MFVLLQIGFLLLTFAGINAQLNEEQMRAALATYNADSAGYCNAQAKANWAVQTDVGNAANEAAQVSKNK